MAAALPALLLCAAGSSFWKAQLPPQVGPLGLEARHAADGAAAPLPPGYAFATLDVRSARDAAELSAFLTAHYQGEASFRVRQSAAQLRWALRPPGMRDEWAVGLRLHGELVAFAAALPAPLALDGARADAVEVTYLCVHAAQRGRKLTAKLVGEVARRVARAGVHVAVYTSASDLPGAVGRARSHHYPLRPRALVESGFVQVSEPFAPLYLARFGGLATRTRTAGLRALRAADLPAAARLLAAAHGRARLGRRFESRDALAHAALPRRGLLASYAVVCPTSGRLRALFTLALSTAAPLARPPAPRGWRRLLPWRRRRGALRAASVQLFAAEAGVDRVALLADALVLARRLGCHVLTALDAGELGGAVRALRFEKGAGALNFYLYNYGLAHRREEGAAADATAAEMPAAPVRSLTGGVRRRAEPARAPLVLRPSEIALPSAL